MITKEDIVNNYVLINPVKLIFKTSLEYEDIFKRIQKHKSKPFTYTIKQNERIREVHFPNYFSYYSVATAIWQELDKINKCSTEFNRMKIDFNNRKLEPDNYRKCFKRDKNNLKFKYDCLSFFDISNFYNSIYTHCFEYIENNKELSFIDENIRLLNSKKTKGLLLGNALSVMCADKVMEYFCSKLISLFKDKNIIHEITFFSDQIYIKHNVDDTKNIYNEVKKVLATDYFEFRLSEQKYKVLTYQDMIKDNIFDKNLEHLRSIFKTIIIKSKEKSTSPSDELRLLKHFLNTLLDQIINSNLDKNLHETFIKVAIKSSFASPVNLHMLYRAIKVANPDDLEEIKNAFLYLISNYPIVIYDMFQLSMFDAIGFKELINYEDMQILYYKLIKHNVHDYELLYWFIKIVVLGKNNINNYEKINYENKVLLAFLIRNSPNVLEDNILSKLDATISDTSNLFNENWLVFYEYLLYKDIQIKSPVGEKIEHVKQLVPVVNELLKKEVSFICNIEELLQINEVSKRGDRWDDNYIPIIPDILRQEAVERFRYN